MAIFLVIQNQFFSALSYGGSAHTKILGLYCSDSQVANGEREGGCSTFCVSVHGTLDLCLRWSWHRQVFLICGTAPWAGILQHSPQPVTGGTKLITNNQAAVFRRHQGRHTWYLHICAQPSTKPLSELGTHSGSPSSLRQQPGHPSPSFLKSTYCILKK